MKYDICFLGDVFTEKKFTQVDRNILDILQNSSAVIANLETPICSRDTGSPANKYSTLKTAHRYIIPLLKDLNISFISLANNHAMDYGSQCLEKTMKILDENNIKWFGAGENMEKASSSLILTVDDYKVGLLGFSTVFVPDARASNNKPGIYGIRVKTVVNIDPKIAIEEPAAPYMINGEVLDEDLNQLLNIIKRLRNKVDILIPYIHWGVGLYPYGELILDYVVRLAHKLIEADVDIIIGSHSHIIQEIEKYKNKLIFYSIGNFLFYPQMYDMGKVGMIVCYNLSNNIIDIYFSTVNEVRLSLLKSFNNCYEIFRVIFKSRKKKVDFSEIKNGLRIKRYR